MKRANRRAIRTLLQLIAGGGLTGLVAAVASGLSPVTSAVVLAAGTLAATYVQNYLESEGVVPTLLPTPPAEVVTPTPPG